MTELAILILWSSFELKCARPVSSRRCWCILVLPDPRGRDVIAMSHCGGIFHRYLFSVLWPVMSFCVNHCPLNEETSLMASEHYSNSEVERKGEKKTERAVDTLHKEQNKRSNSPRGPVSSPTMDYWPDSQCQAWVSSYGSGFKINYKVVGYPYSICVMIMWNLTRAKLQNNTLKLCIYIYMMCGCPDWQWLLTNTGSIPLRSQVDVPLKVLSAERLSILSLGLWRAIDICAWHTLCILLKVLEAPYIILL